MLGKAELHPGDGRELCWSAVQSRSAVMRQRNELSGTQAWRPARAGGCSVGQRVGMCVADPKLMFLLGELPGSGGGERGRERQQRKLGQRCRQEAFRLDFPIKRAAGRLYQTRPRGHTCQLLQAQRLRAVAGQGMFSMHKAHTPAVSTNCRSSLSPAAAL